MYLSVEKKKKKLPNAYQLTIWKGLVWHYFTSGNYFLGVKSNFFNCQLVLNYKHPIRGTGFPTNTALSACYFSQVTEMLRSSTEPVYLYLKFSSFKR